jgi:hypothetical protein
LNIEISAKKLDYIRRLTKSVRKYVNNIPEVVECRKEYGDESIPGNYLDLELLLLSIEEDILKDA